MKYLVSGASSSLAICITRELSRRGHEITLIGRGTERSFSLSQPANSLSELFTSHEVFIHLAHSFEMQEKSDINEQAGHEIVKLLNHPSSQITNCIYISSESASPNAISNYGKSKYKTENAFLQSQLCTVIRLGIILDRNVDSPYQKLKNVVSRIGVLPFPSPYKRSFTSTTVARIVDNLENIVRDGRRGGPLNNEDLSTRKSMVEILREDGIQNKIVLPIPNNIIHLVSSAGKRFSRTRRLADSLSSLLSESDSAKEILE